MFVRSFTAKPELPASEAECDQSVDWLATPVAALRKAGGRTEPSNKAERISHTQALICGCAAENCGARSMPYAGQSPHPCLLRGSGHAFFKICVDGAQDHGVL